MITETRCKTLTAAINSIYELRTANYKANTAIRELRKN